MNVGYVYEDKRYRVVCIRKGDWRFEYTDHVDALGKPVWYACMTWTECSEAAKAALDHLLFVAGGSR